LIIGVLTISFAFAATFPLGIIKFKNGTEMKVKRLSVEDNFVYYKWKSDKRSALLEDIEYLKVRGKIERIAGAVTGGASLLLFGTIYSELLTDMNPDGKSLYVVMAGATTAIVYLGGRLVGSIFDPWRKIYKAPIAVKKIDE